MDIPGDFTPRPAVAWVEPGFLRFKMHWPGNGARLRGKPTFSRRRCAMATCQPAIFNEMGKYQWYVHLS
ncbi:MAG: hypothetical protein OXQ29_20775, partial [Rhodospirillaceae bacterium]|nr:hypothetical protein [Rhodospirillaceae bacterium]